MALATGCDGPTEPSTQSDDERRLAENRARFRASVGSSYRYEYRNVCFCGPDTRLEVQVMVRNGMRTSVTSVADGTPVPAGRWEEFLTVEEVFDVIQGAFDAGAATVQVSYDEALGYPNDVFIDFDERIADEERGFTLARLSPL